MNCAELKNLIYDKFDIVFPIVFTCLIGGIVVICLVLFVRSHLTEEISETEYKEIASWKKVYPNVRADYLDAALKDNVISKYEYGHMMSFYRDHQAGREKNKVKEFLRKQ